MKEISSLIILNRKKQILLQMRDDKPSIPYPNMWTLPGGSVEPGESPEQCIIREMQEEMDLTLCHFKQFLILIKQPQFIEYIFMTKMSFKLETINLHEGQKIQWFTKAETDSIHMAFEEDIIIATFWNSLRYEV